MVSVAFFFKSAAVVSFLLLILGLIEPWWVLWWKPVQNRLEVIRLYGVTALISWLCGVLIEGIIK